MNSGYFRMAMDVRYRGGGRTVGFFLVPLVVFLSCPGLVAQRVFPPSNQPPGAKVEKVTLLKMRVEDGRITADITDSPFQTVLQELADRTGVIFEARSQENPLISIHLQSVPLEEAIQRIASKDNALYLYGREDEPGRITMVRLYPRSGPVIQPGIVYLGTGAVTKANFTVETPEQALQALSSNASIQERETGISILVRSRGDAAVKALMNCVTDPAPEIRVAAIEGLGAMGVRAALPLILKGLKDTHPGVRQSAATAVAMIGTPVNLKDLRPLSFDRDAGVAAAADVAIRKLTAAEKK